MTAPTDNTDIVAFAKAAEKRAEEAVNSLGEDGPRTESDYAMSDALQDDVPTLARMVVKMAETLEAYALDEDEELGKLAYVTLFNLTAELKGSDNADDR